VRQSSNTRELVFSPQEILSYCSRYVTLLPGDVIFTGTPGKTQRVDRGDTVEVTIGGVGTLRNTVAGAATSRTCRAATRDTPTAS
jgi:2-keto-4-pentenoate hydratase/2-oxohepta-3-ene-1,7-dioic acid hydratase in catechol pathway